MKEDRKERLLLDMGEYIYELWKNEDLTFEHANICFGMTKSEYNKYILGKYKRG